MADEIDTPVNLKRQQRASEAVNAALVAATTTTADPIPLRAPPAASASTNIPLTRHYAFNETGNIMVASTIDGSAIITEAARDLFQEVAVFFAAMSKAIAGTANPVGGTYTLYDVQPLEAILQNSGMFVLVTEADFSYSTKSISASFNIELISAILGFAVTDGASVATLSATLGALGQHATFVDNSSSSKKRIGHLLFVCEYIMGMPLVSVNYYSVDESQFQNVIKSPCVDSSVKTFEIRIHREAYMFVPPAWMSKYATDLASVSGDAEFNLLVDELRGFITDTPVVVDVTDNTGPVTTLTTGSGYTINGENFGTAKGTVSIGSVAQTVGTWTDQQITITAARGSGTTPIVGPLTVSLPSNKQAISADQYTVN